MVRLGDSAVDSLDTDDTDAKETTHMMFQKRHYLVLARAIRDVVEFHEAYPKECGDLLMAVAQNLGDALAEDNPLFKRKVFMDACGLPE